MDPEGRNPVEDGHTNGQNVQEGDETADYYDAHDQAIHQGAENEGPEGAGVAEADPPEEEGDEGGYTGAVDTGEGGEE